MKIGKTHGDLYRYISTSKNVRANFTFGGGRVRAHTVIEGLRVLISFDYLCIMLHLQYRFGCVIPGNFANIFAKFYVRD